MNRSKTLGLALLAAAAAALAGLAVTAQATDGADVPQALLTPAQARTIAEVMGQGSATRLRFDDPPGAPAHYEVSVVAPGEARLKLKIAAAGGRILASERGDHADEAVAQAR